jgi:hypothetical protein
VGEAGSEGGLWKWHGAVEKDGIVYCVPQMAQSVLRIDGATDECKFR